MLYHWAVLPLLAAATHVRAHVTENPLNQGFAFDHLVPGETWIIPTVPQCSTIPLEWKIGGATGPAPKAPYSLQVYASIYTNPILVDVGDGPTFDWPVPFENGTVFQVCMFASNGVTGGCWHSFTVIPGTKDCQNATVPDSDGRLDVTATVSETENQPIGELSQFGWVEECSDIQLQPNGGQPPYTLTIAPTLRTPTNLTSDSTDMIPWTVKLEPSLQFFISLASSDGKTWAYGPLHASPGKTSCMPTAPNPSAGASTSGMIAQSKAIGASVGSLIAGLVIGLLCALLVAWLRKRKRRQSEEIGPQGASRVDAFTAGSHATAPNTHQIGSPVPQQDALSPLRYTEPGFSGSASNSSASTPFVPTTYVRRHHDGGAYQTPEEVRRVVELPPEYMSEAGGQRRRLPVPGSAHESQDEGEGSSHGRRSNPSGNSTRGEKTGINY